MRRDVDFAHLRALPGRRVVTAQAGESLARAGAQAQELHVVVSGKVRLTRGGTAVAELGAGELFGEVGLFSGGTHPYDASALAPTTMIAIPAEQALAALAQSPRYAQGLAQTLADRAAQLAALPVGAAAATVTAPAQTAAEPKATAAPAENGAAPAPEPAKPTFGLLIGSALPVPPWEAEKEAAKNAASAPAVDKSIPRPEAFWKKSLKCPICDATFQVNQVRDQFVEVAGRDTDLYEQHRGINTLYYAVTVCPRCFFAAYPDDFPRVFADEKPRIEAALKQVRSKVDQVDFTDRVYRDASQAAVSFELAILCYSQRKGSFRKVAGLYHRLAWLARAAEQADAEKQYLAVARDGYMSALEKREIEEPRLEITVLYLVAELARRLGDTTEAGKWVSQVLQHPQVERHKMIADLARDLRQGLRAAATKQ